MRFLKIAALSFCLLLPAKAEAKPNLAGEFNGDRWQVAQAGTTAADVTRSARCPPLCKPRKGKARQPRKQRRHIVPIPAPRPGSVSPLTLAGGLKRDVDSALASVAGLYMGGNPTGWRSRWCGTFMRMVVKRAGLPDHPSGNLARNWSRYGHDAGGPRPGSIGVLRSHVGVVLGHCPDGRIRLRSGNHGRRVGDGCYAVGRFIAFRAA